MKYPEFCKRVQAVGDAEYRYILIVELEYDYSVQKKSVSVIMLNPSKANAVGSDYTTNKVLRLMQRHGYTEVYIYNLCPKYATNPKEIMKIGLYLNLNTNDEFLTEINSDDVIFAWGDLNFWDSMRNYLANKHPNALCFGKTRLGNPRHPRFVRNPYMLEKFNAD